MQYTAVRIKISECSSEHVDVLVALLDSLNFEGINEQGCEVVAYIPSDKYDRGILELTLAGVKDTFHATIEEEENITERNWNEVWEKNFEPVIIDHRCVIKAPFHKLTENFEYPITIEPKMAFGTGHHETTSLMVSAMLDMELKNKTVLDMGCGTGVLAILAAMKGAKKTIAIDNDKWAYENALENAAKNNVKLEVLLGGEETIPACDYDVILANINRNILIEHAPQYAGVLSFTGRLLLSGFLEEDIEMIESTYVDLGLTPVNHTTMGKWQMLEFVK
ncbi:MAG: 50S ribosomal protein L11 methyltransferase [Bacteroidales bacterium]|nr:50S ribosomal protein L11 methyltransferase [Bacteroidales bacterium]